MRAAYPAGRRSATGWPRARAAGASRGARSASSRPGHSRIRRSSGWSSRRSSATMRRGGWRCGRASGARESCVDTSPSEARWWTPPCTPWSARTPREKVGAARRTIRWRASRSSLTSGPGSWPGCGRSQRRSRWLRERSSSPREIPATPSSCCWRGTSPSAGARDPGKCPSRRSGRVRSRARSPSSRAASAGQPSVRRRPPASCASAATTSSTCSPGSRPSSGRSWARSLAGCATSSRRSRSRSASPRSGPWPRASRTSSTTRPRLPAAASASSTRRSTNGTGPRQPSGR